jgi:hypothetical protein
MLARGASRASSAFATVASGEAHGDGTVLDRASVSIGTDDRALTRNPGPRNAIPRLEPTSPRTARTAQAARRSSRRRDGRGRR